MMLPVRIGPYFLLLLLINTYTQYQGFPKGGHGPKVAAEGFKVAHVQF